MIEDEGNPDRWKEASDGIQTDHPGKLIESLKLLSFLVPNFRVQFLAG